MKLKFLGNQQRIYSLLVMFFIVMFSFSASLVYGQEIRNDRGQLEGRWNGDQFRNAQGKLIYRIDNNGAIRDDAGRLVLRVNGNTFRDSSGKLIGRIDPNGTVRDDAGRMLGRIDDQGAVRDASGRRLGSSNGNSIEKTAVIFFFKDKI